MGGLLGDRIMNPIVAEAVAAYKEKGVILDGYPRTINQGKFLDRQAIKARIPRQLFLYLSVSEMILRERLSDDGTVGYAIVLII